MDFESCTNAEVAAAITTLEDACSFLDAARVASDADERADMLERAYGLVGEVYDPDELGEEEE